MSNFFGKGGGGNGNITQAGFPGFLVTGGGTGAPWTWGVSDFDQSQIDQAMQATGQTTANRYNQLGLGGSTMEQQDEAGNQLAASAQTGQEQTKNVANPALNPALQPQLNSIIGAVNPSSSGSNTTGTTLENLAGQAAGAGTSASAGGSASSDLFAGLSDADFLA